MADHGTVEYATATGNDYPAHEGTYQRFVLFAFVGIIHVINLLFGLAVGGVMGHWFLALPIFIIAVLGVVSGLLSGTKTSSVAAFVICFLIFAFTGISSH
jgi:Bacterial aa3 type cytochrome c oxidase subunit IV